MLHAQSMSLMFKSIRASDPELSQWNKTNISNKASGGIATLFLGRQLQEIKKKPNIYSPKFGSFLSSYKMHSFILFLYFGQGKEL